MCLSVFALGFKSNKITLLNTRIVTYDCAWSLVSCSENEKVL